MAGIIDKYQQMPKWAQITIAVVLVGALVFAYVWFSFDLGKKNEEERQTVYIDMPEGEKDNYDRTRLQTYEENRVMGRGGAGSYWDLLEDDENEDGNMNPSTSSSGAGDDLSQYSDYERMLISTGRKSRAQIDQEHAEDARLHQEMQDFINGKTGNVVSSPQMTQAQQDSAYFARMEKSLDMATKYVNHMAGSTVGAGTQSAEPAEKEEEEPEEELRSIPLTETDSETGTSYISTDDDGSGIISSLDTPSDNGVVHYRGSVKSRPVKATFLKDEKLADGQRVILRLMQDMRLSDGTTIPANTHITGICHFTRRLKINVTMLHYGGRMFPTDISVYDNDGTEGIYCPLAEQASQKSKKIKNVASDILSTAGGVAGTVFSGNPLLGSMMGSAASSAIRSATSSIASDGTITVNVAAGYQFYVFENLKDDGSTSQKSSSRKPYVMD